ncbi:hypothetical protein CPB84DRAFT_1797299 [Gymnopilus junonius]|uniref:Ran guanine nucleotide release factor n=1 Tax=Gymnopilus junonius TaxID=109634 RepID=A0A9P5NC11_GYMJU|nr:hypothetical protein CPB84DRAFT_1797299 [Gymnopilus junonius]
MSVRRDLFGGAVVADTPNNLIDASDLRQVPDTQEVFVYPNSSVSIIFEILQRVQVSQSDDAIRFHFNSLAHDNSASSAKVESVSVIPNDRGDDTPLAIVLRGEQSVQKFNYSTPDTVMILMALFRIESKSVDLVATCNVPLQAVDGGAVSNRELENVQRDFDTVVRTLRVVDFGLFA